MEVGVLTRNLQGFVPYKGMNTKGWREVELDKRSDALSVDKGKGIDTEPLHHAQRPWDTTVAHSPHEHVCGFGV